MLECIMCKTNKQDRCRFLKSVNMAGDVIKKREMFYYLVDVVCTECGTQ